MSVLVAAEDAESGSVFSDVLDSEGETAKKSQVVKMHHFKRHTAYAAYMYQVVLSVTVCTLCTPASQQRVFVARSLPGLHASCMYFRADA